MFLRSLLSILLITSTLSACAPEAAERTTAVQNKESLVPEGLVLLPHGKDIQRADNYDGRIKYQLNEPFPADSAIKTLDKNLAAGGWISVPKDLFNPGGSNVPADVVDS